MSDLELRLQFVDRTINYDFPDNIDEALENDYVENSQLYTDDIFKKISMYLLLTQDTSLDKIMAYIKSLQKHNK